MRIFLDEVGSDQSGGILSPFMGTACFKKCYLSSNKIVFQISDSWRNIDKTFSKFITITAPADGLAALAASF